ncbi:MAG: ATP-binding protein [SAR324 cluster bacterium]|nr:ATP-binding protein [SAR324 cluster bacterium]
MIRSNYLKQIEQGLLVHKVVALLGPRQSGKTTLARMYAELLRKEKGTTPEQITHFDLEDPTDIAALKNPKLVLRELSGLVIIDEIQRVPELFPVLRVLVDLPDNRAHFLILGSASRDLIRQSSESLAGRIAHIELTPFQLLETSTDKSERLWLRGGFPPSFLAKDNSISWQWRKEFIKSFLERDLPALGIGIPPQSLRRFWMMLAHYHGQIVNFSELGRSFGASDSTIRRYLDLLNGTFMVRRLSSWHENISKRQVKAPKLYFRDSGLFHSLLGIENRDQLNRHPKLGASWEGFAIEEVIRCTNVTAEDCYFWATHTGAEIDLLTIQDGKKRGFEFKYSDHPKATKSMHAAMESLKLDSLTVISPTERSFPLSEKIRVVSLKDFVQSSRAEAQNRS